MQVSWYGQSCLKFTSAQTTLITDPLDPKTGIRLPKMPADVLVLSQPDEPSRSNASIVGGSPFRIDGPGEYEVKGIFIYGIADAENPGTIDYKFLIEQMSVGILHGLTREPSQAELELLEGTDILFIPVGQKGGFDAKRAAAVVSQLEPRIIVPIDYAIKGLREKLDTEKPFVKELGQAELQSIAKLKIVQSQLPQEHMVVNVLTPSV